MKKFKMTYKEIYFNEHGFKRERYKQMEVNAKSAFDVFEDFKKAGYEIVFVEEM